MERRTITLRGVVQGVGLRPFVFGLASRFDLRGFVQNQMGSLRIEVEGETDSLEGFLTELATKPPPLARIDHLGWERQQPKGDLSFCIEPSDGSVRSNGGTVRPPPVFVSPDAATCGDCLRELFDAGDRRYRYPFLNCTNCGPRLTLITGSPYDRDRTTMAAFPMCAACRAEYDDPADRRFHAQPIACPACGPRLQALNEGGDVIVTNDPLACLIAVLRAGGVGALKGLGGYHLVCDARNESAVALLRHRKNRDEKPFAVMVPNFKAADALCEVSPAEKTLLLSPRRPIVLLRARRGSPTPPGCGGVGDPRRARGKRHAPGVAEGVAPRNPFLGVMLPYTPLHHLLLHAMMGTPLVMTSGNRSDEPIAYEDADAVKRLSGIADLFLVHDRAIHVRCDDSVTRVVDGLESPLRRSRGYAPQPILMPLACPRPVLAVGGQLKATFALGRERHAFISHYLGDLDDYGAFRAFTKDVGLYQQLFAIEPQVIAHDLHPDYASTRYALERAGGGGVRRVAVQHHHAHMASCMAEHGLTEPVIGVTFDGTGFGTDGAVWGGEVLVGDYRTFRRAAHLRYVGMPGGEQAVREPWRMAVAHLADAGCKGSRLGERLPPVALRTVEKMLERRFQTPLTSSAGRLFDAVAALAGLRDRVRYEGQAAVELEWLAAGVSPDGAYPFDLVETWEEELPEPVLVVDTRPLVRAVAGDAWKGIEAALIARRFHSAMVAVIAAVCGRLRSSTGLDAVVLSGGVFSNALLTGEACARLGRDGFRVYRHRLVPPNDGGLCLGQLAIAAQQAAEGPNR